MIKNLHHDGINAKQPLPHNFITLKVEKIHKIYATKSYLLIEKDNAEMISQSYQYQTKKIEIWYLNFIDDKIEYYHSEIREIRDKYTSQKAVPNIFAFIHM